MANSPLPLYIMPISGQTIPQCFESPYVTGSYCRLPPSGITLALPCNLAPGLSLPYPSIRLIAPQIPRATTSAYNVPTAL